MENKFSTITSDGRIKQKDNAFFSGRELAQVNPEEAEEALKYFQDQFSQLEKYVDSRLRIIRSLSRQKDGERYLDQLREEIIATSAIGDYAALLEKVDSLKEERLMTPEESASGEPDISEAGQTEESDQKHSVGAQSDTGNGMNEKKAAGDEETGGIETEEEVTGEEKTGKEKTGEEKTGEIETDSSRKPADREYPESLNELVELEKKAWELSKMSDWQTVQHEFENIRFKWEELLEADETLASGSGYGDLLESRNTAEQTFKKRKAEWQEIRRERKQVNLEKRARLLDQMQEVIDKKRWQAIKRVGSISNKWEEIRDLPNDDEARKQEQKFQALVREFNEKKVEFLVKKAQKEEENLVGKLAIIEKMNQVVESAGPDTEHWEKLDKELEELTIQWKKIGHVPIEQSDKIWEQFKSVRDDYFNKKFQHNKTFRDLTQKNIRKKTRLCEEVEALLEEEDLAKAVREINNLHKKWKKIGSIPKEKNDELWDRFNAATRKFNEIKSHNLETIRNQEQENLAKKIALCERAEELEASTDWTATSRELDDMMKQWKGIGPVPRRKAGKVWRRLKKAMDNFYENRRKHYRVVRDEQKENYQKKKTIIAELEKLVEYEDLQEAVKLAKELQEEFKKIGFVPIKKKNKIENDYKDVCDRIYQRVRKKGKSTGTSGRSTGTGSGNKSMRDEYFKLKKECDKLHEEIMRYQDSMTFINPGGKGNALIDEVRAKIDKTQKKLEEKQEKLEELRTQVDD